MRSGRDWLWRGVGSRQSVWTCIWWCPAGCGRAGGKEPACQCGRHETWVRFLGKTARQSSPGLLPGGSHGQRSLVGYRPCGHTVGHDWGTWHAHLRQDGSHVTLEVRAGEVGLRGVCTEVSVKAIGEAHLEEKINDSSEEKHACFKSKGRVSFREE